MVFFSPIIFLNTSCRVEIGWYSRYRAIRWTVFVWKWNLRTKSCHFPWCWRTRRNTRLILHERLLQSYYAIHQFHLWNHQNAWITNCNSIIQFFDLKPQKMYYLGFFFLQGFKCICKLVEFYKKNKLPSCNLNLGIPFPKSLIPPTEAEADCSDEVKRQYAGIRLWILHYVNEWMTSQK